MFNRTPSLRRGLDHSGPGSEQSPIWIRTVVLVTLFDIVTKSSRELFGPVATSSRRRRAGKQLQRYVKLSIDGLEDLTILPNSDLIDTHGCPQADIELS